jgi:glycerol-3-phosphate dehydrogenase (NAD(P)+)
VLWGAIPRTLLPSHVNAVTSGILPQAAVSGLVARRGRSGCSRACGAGRAHRSSSHSLRLLLQEIAPHLGADARVSWATKGFELATGLLPHEVVRHVLGERVPTAVVSGPTFAKEVGAGCRLR